MFKKLLSISLLIIIAGCVMPSDSEPSLSTNASPFKLNFTSEQSVSKIKQVTNLNVFDDTKLSVKSMFQNKTTMNETITNETESEEDRIQEGETGEVIEEADETVNDSISEANQTITEVNETVSEGGEGVVTEPETTRIEYPVTELGNCSSQSECETYCDQEGHLSECLTFAEEHDLLPEEELTKMKKVLELMNTGQAPGGCSILQECESYCSQEAHRDECGELTGGTGPGTGEEREESQWSGNKAPDK